MSYFIRWDQQPLKFLQKLERHTAKRILDKLDEVAIDPFRYLEHYEGDGYKLRIGDFRMIIDINQNEKVLTIQVFDKRGRVYK
jgi:mRNA interferase RelE/StbE